MFYDIFISRTKKQSKIIRYPLAPSFYCQTRRKRNILNLAKHDVKHLARKAGTVVINVKTEEMKKLFSESNKLTCKFLKHIVHLEQF